MVDEAEEEEGLVSDLVARKMQGDMTPQEVKRELGRRELQHGS